MRNTPVVLRAAMLAFGSMLATSAVADEGMWLFNRPPTQALKQQHDFAVDAGWLEHVQKSCVRFGRGGVGVDRFSKRTGDDQSPRWSRAIAKAEHG